jgi:pyridoxamine 5'-phosphate oxidase
MRRSYDRAGLDESALAPTWHQQLRRWFDEAVAAPAVLDPNAVALATADQFGRPAVRTVLVKRLDEGGIVFYTNYESAKGRDLADRPYASALFAWSALERQVRLSGGVERIPAPETAAYFASRPRGSQLGAWASAQSRPVASRAELDDALAEVSRRFGDGEVPVPPNWGGFRLVPDEVEFWQGRPNRMHDRLRFRATPGGWLLERLAP